MNAHSLAAGFVMLMGCCACSSSSPCETREVILLLASPNELDRLQADASYEAQNPFQYWFDVEMDEDGGGTASLDLYRGFTLAEISEKVIGTLDTLGLKDVTVPELGVLRIHLPRTLRRFTFGGFGVSLVRAEEKWIMTGLEHQSVMDGKDKPQDGN